MLLPCKECWGSRKTQLQVGTSWLSKSTFTRFIVEEIIHQLME